MYQGIMYGTPLAGKQQKQTAITTGLSAHFTRVFARLDALLVAFAYLTTRVPCPTAWILYRYTIRAKVVLGALYIVILPGLSYNIFIQVYC